MDSNSNNRIIQLIKNYQLIKKVDKEIIEQTLEKYPYVQAFQFLMLIWKANYSKINIEEQKEKLSIYSSYREYVGEYIENIQKQESDKFVISQESNRVENILGVLDNFVNKNYLEEDNLVEDDTTNSIFKSKKEEIAYKTAIDKLGLSYLFIEDISNKKENDIDIKEGFANDNEFDNDGNQTGIENINVEIKNQQEKEIQVQILERNDQSLDDVNIEKDIKEPEINERKLLEIEKNNLTLAITQDNRQENRSTIINNSKLSFNEWLSSSEKKINIQIDEKENEFIKQDKQKEIINKFIETNPKIAISQKGTIQKGDIIDLKKDEIKEIANLMTVTLAQLYVEQGKYETAITAFKILSLKYPDQKGYFAKEIKKIKKIK